jgi:hypothetical protein
MLALAKQQLIRGKIKRVCWWFEGRAKVGAQGVTVELLTGCMNPQSTADDFRARTEMILHFAVSHRLA